MPPAPRLWSAIKAAALAFYYNSWRFLPANIVFGATLLAVLFVSAVTPLGVLLTVVLIVPAAGVMRMATHLVRERYVFFSEFAVPMRRHRWRLLGLGVAQLVIVLVLVVDLFVGVALNSLIGAFLSVSAVYALVALWAYATVAWPLLLDPVREDERPGSTLRLAALLLLAHPVRVGGTTVVVGLIVLLSTITIAAIVTFALAFAWLVAAHFVLPAADRFEERATLEVED